MSGPFPTIKNFYSPFASPSKHRAPSEGSSLSKPLNSRDGFTSSARLQEITLSPSSQWSPEHDYEEVSISDLCPGPRWATFTCRVVNIYDQTIESKMPRSAKGYLKILVKDESATILIKLLYATTSYDLHLGTLLTCWTTHVHSTSSLAGINDAVALPLASIMTSIFPERDSGCHIQIHDEEGRLSARCRTPLGYFSGDPLPGLISLDQYMNGGGNDMLEARLIFCVVAVGKPMTITTKTGTQFITLDVGITDHSCSATLSLSQPLFTSAQSWAENETIILISFPKLYHAGRISTTKRSHIDVDPDIAEAMSLRKNIQRENCPINQTFPEGVFDIEAIESSPIRLQFTFATLSEFVEAGPGEIITGYISVILSQVNLMYLFARKQLFSMECCDMPIYSNKTTGRCGQCGNKVELRVNPNIVGSMADETGAVGINPPPVIPTSSLKTAFSEKKQYSKVLWTDEAWCQLLGRDGEELAKFCREDVSLEMKEENIIVLRYLEQRLLWMRVILLVGWTGEAQGGRLAVLKVVA